MIDAGDPRSDFDGLLARPHLDETRLRAVLDVLDGKIQIPENNMSEQIASAIEVYRGHNAYREHAKKVRSSLTHLSTVAKAAKKLAMLIDGPAHRELVGYGLTSIAIAEEMQMGDDPAAFAERLAAGARRIQEDVELVISMSSKVPQREEDIDVLFRGLVAAYEAATKRRATVTSEPITGEVSGRFVAFWMAATEGVLKTQLTPAAIKGRLTALRKDEARPRKASLQHSTTATERDTLLATEKGVTNEATCRSAERRGRGGGGTRAGAPASRTAE